jgi:hypothetical protein
MFATIGQVKPTLHNIGAAGESGVIIVRKNNAVIETQYWIFPISLPFLQIKTAKEIGGQGVHKS